MILANKNNYIEQRGAAVSVFESESESFAVEAE